MFFSKKSLIFFSLFFVGLMFLSSQSASAQTQTICTNAPVPQGWLITNADQVPGTCGLTSPGPNNHLPNVYEITRYDNKFRGAVLEICGVNQQTPANWIVKRTYINNFRCGAQIFPPYSYPVSSNVTVIENVSGPVQPGPNQPPIGYMDTVNLNTRKVSGWSLDPNSPSASIEVHFYIDGPVGTGTIVGSATANIPRPDVNTQTGHPGNHGYEFPIPSTYFDGANHTIYAYGIDTTGGTNPLLTNSPLTFNFPSYADRTPFDFNGDGRADQTVFRTGAWYSNLSPSNTFSGYTWGQSGDIPVPADFDGDGKTDIAILRPNGSARDWYILQSSDSQARIFQYGLAVDKPVPADYDGDTKADAAVFRPDNGYGYWYILNSSTNQSTTQLFGFATDKPVPADYDNDGKTDLAIYRPSDGTWHINRTNLGYTSVQFGISTDKPVPADYDGDNKTDIAVFRDGEWYILKSSGGVASYTFGQAGDTAAPADYDGDGKTDVAYIRSVNGTNVWNILQSSNGQTVSLTWGFSTDITVTGQYAQ